MCGKPLALIKTSCILCIMDVKAVFVSCVPAAVAFASTLAVAGTEFISTHA